jgi:hypothetical protein
MILRSLVAKFLLFTMALAVSISAIAQSDIARLVEYENLGNEMVKKSTSPIQLLHFEIPLELLKIDEATYADPNIRRHLIFSNSGKEYFRWIINPTDVTYHKELSNWLSSKGIEVQPKRYFTAYSTASSSLLLVAPDGFHFSAKSSTDFAGGKWQKKPHNKQHLKNARGISDYVSKVHKQMGNESRIQFQLDSFGAHFEDPKAPDQSIVIREIGDTTNLVPGFAFGHRKYGKLIPHQGWDSALRMLYYNLGLGLGELFSLYGLFPNAPHGQNFLLDTKTQKLVVRDLADMRIFESMMRKLGHDTLIHKFPRKIESADGIRVGAAVGLFHGSIEPNWIKTTESVDLILLFLKTYWVEVARNFGQPYSEVKKTLGDITISTGGYSHQVLSKKNEFLKLLPREVIQKHRKFNESFICQYLSK